VYGKNDKWMTKKKDKSNSLWSAQAEYDPKPASSAQWCKSESSHRLQWTWISLLCFWETQFGFYFNHTPEPDSAELV